MARAKKTKSAFTFESNLEKVVSKIKEKPYKVMGVIGGNLVREIKATTMKTQFHRRRALLAKTLEWAYGYDMAKSKKDTTSLQIGFKMSIPGIVGKMMSRAEEDPLKPVVLKNAELIKSMIAQAIDEINKE